MFLDVGGEKDRREEQKQKVKEAVDVVGQVSFSDRPKADTRTEACTPRSRFNYHFSSSPISSPPTTTNRPRSSAIFFFFYSLWELSRSVFRHLEGTRRICRDRKKRIGPDNATARNYFQTMIVLFRGKRR